MVTTWSTSSQPDTSKINPGQTFPTNQVLQTNPLSSPSPNNFLSSLASRLDAIYALAAEVAALKAQASSIPPADISLGVNDKSKTKGTNMGPKGRGRTSWSEEDEEEVHVPSWVPVWKLNSPNSTVATHADGSWRRKNTSVTIKLREILRSIWPQCTWKETR